MSPAGANSGRGRGRLLLLAGVFLVPMLLASWLYYVAGWQPPSSISRGELIQPPRPLPKLSLPLAAGTHAAEPLFRKHWSLVYLGEGACDATCQLALQRMGQAHLALDKDASRLRRVFLYHGRCCDEAWLRDQPAGLLAVALAGPQGAQLQAIFAGLDAGQVFVVDPLGNLMMSYAAETPAGEMLKDLERLLRLSQIG